MRCFWFVVLFVAACSPKGPALVAEPAAEPVTVIQNVAVFSGISTGVTVAQDVWLRGKMVSHIGPTGAKELPAGAAIVAGEGRTLIPGLIDMHVHSEGGSAPPWALGLPNADRNIRTFLYGGITTMVDLGGGIADVTARRDAIAQKKEVGPRMLVSGPHFTAPGSHPIAMLRLFLPWIVSIFLESGMAYQVGTVEDVVAVFDDYLAYRPDVVKITSDQIPLGVPTIAPAVAAEIVARAHAAGLKVFAHVGDNADTEKVASAGVDILAHGIYRERISEATIKLLAEKGVKVTPTLAVYDHIDRLATGDYTLSAMQLAVGDAKTVAAIQGGPGKYQLPAEFDEWKKVTRAHRDIKFENVAALHKHGVTILVGSDSPNIGQFGGASLHDEMDLLVQAGMTPGEVLRAATYENAKALGLDKEIGTVEVGKLADLVLVNGDPTSDIAAVHAIEAVYLGGAKIDRSLK